MKKEFCKRHKTDHTGTVCGGCYEMHKKKSYKLDRMRKKAKEEKKEIEYSAIVLKNLVESFYKQKPLPKTAVVFKLGMSRALDYLKSQGVPLPNYEEFQRTKKEVV